MHPVLFHTKYLTLYSWGFMAALGYLSALIVSIYLSRKSRIPADHVMNLYILMVIASVIGARTFFVIQFFGDYMKSPLEMFMVQRGGLVFLGGFIAAMAAIIAYCAVNKLEIWSTLDVISPGVMLGYALGRVGCFLNGCCYGVEANIPWAVVFPGETCLRHPTQLYSAAAGLLIFAVLLVMFANRSFDGQVFLLEAALYSVYRFLLEFLRYSPVHSIGLTPSQYILVLIFAAAVYTLWKKKNSTS